MEKYNVQAKHASTNEWTNIFWHLKDKLEAYDMLYALSKTGLPCQIIQESYPEDIVLKRENI